MRKGSKRLLQAGMLSGLAYAGWRVVAGADSRGAPCDRVGDGPVPVPADTATCGLRTGPRPTRASSPAIEPDADGTCPVSHPVKAKLASGIYHEPGGGNYERTKADRCYVDAAAAEADGLRLR